MAATSVESNQWPSGIVILLPGCGQGGSRRMNDGSNHASHKNEGGGKIIGFGWGGV